MKTLIKFYLKSFKNKKHRELRSSFIGRRLAVKQHRWLHFNSHPEELVDTELLIDKK